MCLFQLENSLYLKYEECYLDAIQIICKIVNTYPSTVETGIDAIMDFYEEKREENNCDITIFILIHCRQLVCHKYLYEQRHDSIQKLLATDISNLQNGSEINSNFNSPKSEQENYELELDNNQLTLTYQLAVDSLIWLLAVIGQYIELAPYILEKIVENNFDNLLPSSQIEVLDAAFRLYFSRTIEISPTLKILFSKCLSQLSEKLNLDVVEKASFYFNLLETDIELARKVANVTNVKNVILPVEKTNPLLGFDEFSKTTN